MAQPKQKKSSPYDHVLKLVEQLPSKQRERLRLELDRKARHQEWRDRVTATAEAGKKRTPLTEKEILAEVKVVKPHA